MWQKHCIQYVPLMFVCFLLAPVICSVVFSNFSRLNVQLSEVLSGATLSPFLERVAPAVLWPSACPTPSIQERDSSGTLVQGMASHWKSLLSKGLSWMKSNPQRSEASFTLSCKAAWYTLCNCSWSTGPKSFRRVGRFPRVLRICLWPSMILHCR